MALRDRVANLAQTNLNDLIDRAENPGALNQVILDMENQFMQVKTQVAIAIADLHLLEKKKKDTAEKHAEWLRRVSLAVDKKDDESARAARERAKSFRQLVESFDQQITEQGAQVESLKADLKRREVKLSEARGKAHLLISQHRRAPAASQVIDAQLTPDSERHADDPVLTEDTREEAREYAQVLAHAVDTFGSRTNANAWLNKPNRVFHNRSPLQILTEDPAAVEEELVRIDHGMYL